MDNYGINMVGEFKVERVSTKDTWTSADIGRIIFVTSENSFYVGGNYAWISASSDLTTHMSDTTTHGITTGAIVGTTDVQTLTNKTIDADNNTISDISNDEIKIGANIDAAKIATGIISNTEFNYLNGVTSNIQTQLNAKEATIDLTASRAMVTNSSGEAAVSSVTSTEVGYLDGVTSAIQDQLDAKEATIALTASRAMVTNGSGGVTVSSVTSTELGYLDGVTSAIQTQLDAFNVITGSVMIYPKSTVPSEYLECDGAAVSRTTYSDLYSVIGTTYGVGNGSTTFNLPDYRGRFLRGWDHGAGLDPDAATRTDRGDGQDGDYVGTKQADAFKSHTHTEEGVIQTGSGYAQVANVSMNSVSQNTGATGGSETRPVNINVMYCIKY